MLAGMLAGAGSFGSAFLYILLFFTPMMGTPMLIGCRQRTFADRSVGAQR